MMANRLTLSMTTGRYPLHQARKRIEEEHGEELKKLHTPEGDFVHGIHAGILAASRMFEKHADILHVNEHDELTDELLSAVAEHQKAVEEAKETFPHVAVDTKPPSED